MDQQSVFMAKLMCVRETVINSVPGCFPADIYRFGQKYKNISGISHISQNSGNDVCSVNIHCGCEIPDVTLVLWVINTIRIGCFVILTVPSLFLQHLPDCFCWTQVVFFLRNLNFMQKGEGPGLVSKFHAITQFDFDSQRTVVLLVLSCVFGSQLSYFL